jgi:hypothetical protein
MIGRREFIGTLIAAGEIIRSTAQFRMVQSLEIATNGLWARIEIQIKGWQACLRFDQIPVHLVYGPEGAIGHMGDVHYVTTVPILIESGRLTVYNDNGDLYWTAMQFPCTFLHAGDSFSVHPKFNITFEE